MDHQHLLDVWISCRLYAYRLELQFVLDGFKFLTLLPKVLGALKPVMQLSTQNQRDAQTESVQKETQTLHPPLVFSPVYV